MLLHLGQTCFTVSAGADLGSRQLCCNFSQLCTWLTAIFGMQGMANLQRKLLVFDPEDTACEFTADADTSTGGPFIAVPQSSKGALIY